MFIRTVKARGKKGEQHEYLRLVENYRENDRTRQRVVISLGRKDLLAPHLDSLVRVLGGEGPDSEWVQATEVKPEEAACWGVVLVARHLWQELGLDDILDACEGKKRRAGASFSERAFVLVVNRLCSPGSEHHLANWLETDYVCDRNGQRWLPLWEEHGRVQVNLTWLQRWYRTLDKLIESKEGIEQSLYLKLRDLFSLKAELVFYDLTSTYFEGAGPPGLGHHGYSRDSKPHNEQVQIGVVMVNGWPIAHHVFPGNWREFDTVKGVLDDLEKRFGLGRVVFVGDRGMVTTDNLEMLRERHQGYLVGLQRRRREDIYQLIGKATGTWQECPLPAGARATGNSTLVQEVSGDQPGVRVFVVHSEERLAYERAMRERSMERTGKALEKLEGRVAGGKLKAPEKIGAAAAQILSRNHGHRYFGWEVKEGKFRYFEHSNLEREKAYEGKYLIQTEEQGLSPVEAVAAYKELSEVERAFRCLKDVIEMRPIYHRDDGRVQGHIFVAVLAFLLKRALEKKLKAAGSHLSGEAALDALRTIHVVRMQVGTERRQGVTGGSSRAREVLEAVGITATLPPQVL
ncbi:MAG: IS1634 family transposase [Dehalococcoidales bacterium]|nr:IS1634 family transposase [Dehalococcoidales bacterium]